MDLGTAAGAILAAFGLSGAAGLNAWLPLFASALLARFDVVELGGGFEQLSTTPGLIALGAFTVADFVGDKVPVVDHVLHLLGAVVAPASGAVLFTAPTADETSLPTVVSIVLGALVAGSVHAARAAVRPAATATTGGAANPALSLGEDATSAVLTAFSFLLPIVAAVLLVVLIVALVVGWRRLRAALRRS